MYCNSFWDNLLSSKISYCDGPGDKLGFTAIFEDLEGWPIFSVTNFMSKTLNKCKRITVWL